MTELQGTARPSMHVLSPGAVKGVLEQLVPAFTRETGRAVECVFGTAGATRERFESGAPADLVILTDAAMQALEASGAIDGPGRVLGRMGMGLVVRSGASAPNIGSPEAFREALLGAPSVACTDPAGGGTGGRLFAGLLERLGVTEAVGRKAVLAPNGHAVARCVAAGEAAIGVTMISEILTVPGAHFAAPLPAELQLYTTYAAGIPRRSENGDGGRVLLDFLTGESSSAYWRGAGFLPA